MTNSIADLKEAEVVLCVGSNTTAAHPIIGIELKKAALAGTRIYVIDPRRIELTRHATRHLAIEPGTNVALFNAMLKVIIDEGLLDEQFIAEKTEGFDRVRALVSDYDLEWAAETCGVTVEAIRELAIAYGSAKRAAIVYAMGVTQHVSGTEQVRALANLAMATGHIGRPGTGVNPLRGQNNVQGACDLACLPNCLPGYQPLTDRGTLDRVCDYWETERELPAEPGLTLVEMMDAAVAGELKALYVMGENPVIADPDQAHVIEALEALDFLVVQDIFLTETAAFADVVLPAASFLEKDGTFTNTDRTIKRVRTVVEPPAGARTDLDIILDLSRRLGVDAEYDSAGDVMDEMAAVTPQYGGISYRRLESEGSLQWPCPTDDHPGTPILHAERFTRGLGAFLAVDYTPAPEVADDARPLLLTTGRDLWNFHTNTMTSRSTGLGELATTAYVEIHPADAERLGVSDGVVVELASRHGQVEVVARVSDRVGRGVAYMPFHFADSPANRLTGGTLDPSAKIPGLKVTAISCRPIVTGDRP